MTWELGRGRESAPSRPSPGTCTRAFNFCRSRPFPPPSSRPFRCREQTQGLPYPADLFRPSRVPVPRSFVALGGTAGSDRLISGCLLYYEINLWRACLRRTYKKLLKNRQRDREKIIRRPPVKFPMCETDQPCVQLLFCPVCCGLGSCHALYAIGLSREEQPLAPLLLERLMLPLSSLLFCYHHPCDFFVLLSSSVINVLYDYVPCYDDHGYTCRLICLIRFVQSFVVRDVVTVIVLVALDR